MKQLCNTQKAEVSEDQTKQFQSERKEQHKLETGKCHHSVHYKDCHHRQHLSTLSMGFLGNFKVNPLCPASLQRRSMTHMWSVFLNKPQINIRMKRQSELFLRNHLPTPSSFSHFQNYTIVKVQRERNNIGSGKRCCWTRS